MSPWVAASVPSDTLVDPLHLLADLVCPAQAIHRLEQCAGAVGKLPPPELRSTAQQLFRDAVLTEVSAILIVGLKDASRTKVCKRKHVQSKIKSLKEHSLSESDLRPALLKRCTQALQLK